MTKSLPRTIFACLMISFLFAQPVLAFGLATSDSDAALTNLSRPFQTHYPSGIETNRLASATPLPQVSNGTEDNSERMTTQPKSNETAVAGKNLKKNPRQVLSASRKNRTLAHHASRTCLVVNDCDACHQGCLAASLTCIAISIVTACLPCGVICLAGQAACEGICNTTSACNPVPEQNAN
jgi:hypothetical protein